MDCPENDRLLAVFIAKVKLYHRAVQELTNAMEKTDFEVLSRNSNIAHTDCTAAREALSAHRKTHGC